MNVNEKREQEIVVVAKMVEIYCHSNKHTKKGLCQECSSLLEYAKGQVKKCPHMEEKTFCSTCKTHCYRPEMRDKIKQIMRYAGPKMLLHHPILTVKHGINTLKEKRENKKAESDNKDKKI